MASYARTLVTRPGRYKPDPKACPSCGARKDERASHCNRCISDPDVAGKEASDKWKIFWHKLTKGTK